jgi:hypothetical protein
MNNLLADNAERHLSSLDGFKSINQSAKLRQENNAKPEITERANADLKRL